MCKKLRKMLVFGLEKTALCVTLHNQTNGVLVFVKKENARRILLERALVIYMFRKEMKKWQNILWVVLASLVLGTLYGIKFGPSRMGDVRVARVNGYDVTFDEYRRSLVEIQERINTIRQMAKVYGMPEETFLQAYGFDNPQALALDSCVQEKLYDQIKDQLSIRVDGEWFKQELIKTMPHLLDAEGRVNINAYHDYLQRLSMTPAEFEHRRAEEVKRDMLLKFVQHTAYVPSFIAKEGALRVSAGKSFEVLSCKIDSFMSEAKAAAENEKDVNAFFLGHKDRYKEPELRSAVYWELNTKNFMNAVELDQAVVRQFYEKHKATMYRIPPKVKVRRLVLKAVGNGLPKMATEILKKAQEKPGQFSALIKQYSTDEKTAQNGGIVDFFIKGSRDPEFEKAAFRLKEVGDISPLIKTKDGYEILQLVERIAGGEKSFESVKDEIVASLRAKKAMGALRAELEYLVRAAKTDASALDTFATKYHSQAHRTELLSQTDATDNTIVSMVVKKLFAPQGKSTGIGYFAHEDCYVIYKLDQIKKSYVPKYEEVRARVTKDFIKEQAEVIAKRTFKNLRVAVLAGKKSIQEAVADVKGSFSKTDIVTKAKDLKLFGDERGLKERLFALSDPSQVLFIAHKENYYLAKISQLVISDKIDLAKETAKQAKSEQAKIGSLQMGAFIASLHRNAKIEVENKNIIEMQPVKE
jgi:peptidyl-prolyl cis-trans isomerase D